jgi:hypothetical protein
MGHSQLGSILGSYSIPGIDFPPITRPKPPAQCVHCTDPLTPQAEAEFMNVQFPISLRFLGIISDLRFPYTMFTLQNSFQTTFARGREGREIKIEIHL